MQHENDVGLPGFDPPLSTVTSLLICSMVVIVVSNPGTYCVNQLTNAHAYTHFVKS